MNKHEIYLWVPDIPTALNAIKLLKKHNQELSNYAGHDAIVPPCHLTFSKPYGNWRFKRFRSIGPEVTLEQLNEILSNESNGTT